MLDNWTFTLLTIFLDSITSIFLFLSFSGPILEVELIIIAVPAIFWLGEEVADNVDSDISADSLLDILVPQKK